jgi:hypothetical protein
MIVERTSLVIGVVAGALYGLLLRLAMVGSNNSVAGSIFGLVTIAFVFVMPLILGIITVTFWPAAFLRARPGEPLPPDSPTVGVAIALPWLSVLLCLTAMVAMKLEGLICTIVVLPVFLAMSTIGGLIGRSIRRRQDRKTRGTYALMLLPFLVAPLENQIDANEQLRRVTTSIEIAAPASVVWPNIADVRRIDPTERPWRSSALIGIPDPVEAILAEKRVGGVRAAHFARGIRFDEIVTDYRPMRSLAFDIRANTNEIPPTTLDEHVLVGGRYFDVLNGAFELRPAGRNRTLLILRSTHRLSTHFNGYAGLWSDWIMRDVQNTLLQIIKARCEQKTVTKPGIGT